MINANNNTRPTRTITVNTRFSAKSIETALTKKEAFEVIRADKRSSSFALDLLEKGKKWNLSPIQVNWVIFLAQESINKNVPVAAPTAPIADFKPLFDLFGTAHLNLKYPRLRLQTNDGRMVLHDAIASGQSLFRVIT
jgi:hypothetical protein